MCVVCNRIKAAAEKYMCSSTSSEQQTQLKPGQQVIDTDKFKKLLQEADPSSCSVVDSNLNQQTRDKYTGIHPAASYQLTIEVALLSLQWHTACIMYDL